MDVDKPERDAQVASSPGSSDWEADDEPVIYEPLPSCPICLLDILDPREKALTSCTHVFCRRCLEEWLKRKRFCPLCKRRVSTYITDVRSDAVFLEVPVPLSPPAHTHTHTHLHTHHHQHQPHGGGPGHQGPGGGQAYRGWPAGGSTALTVAQLLQRDGDAARLQRQLYDIADRVARADQPAEDPDRPARFRSAGSQQPWSSQQQQQQLPRNLASSASASSRQQRGRLTPSSSASGAAADAAREPRPYFFRVQQRLAATAHAVGAHTLHAVGAGAGSGSWSEAELGEEAGGARAAARASSGTVPERGLSARGGAGAGGGVAGDAGGSGLGVHEQQQQQQGVGAGADTGTWRMRVYDMGLWADGIVAAPGLAAARAAGGLRAAWRAAEAAVAAAAGSGPGVAAGGGGGARGAGVVQSLAGPRREAVERWVERELRALLPTGMDTTLLRGLVMGLLDLHGTAPPTATTAAAAPGSSRTPAPLDLHGTAASTPTGAAGAAPGAAAPAAPAATGGGRAGGGAGGNSSSSTSLAPTPAGAPVVVRPRALVSRKRTVPAAAPALAPTRARAGTASGVGIGPAEDPLEGRPDGTGGAAAGSSVAPAPSTAAAAAAPVAALTPFLFGRAEHFWHELRCFAASGLAVEAYDSAVRYAVRPTAPNHEPPPPPPRPQVQVQQEGRAAARGFNPPVRPRAVLAGPPLALQRRPAGAPSAMQVADTSSRQQQEQQQQQEQLRLSMYAPGVPVTNAGQGLPSGPVGQLEGTAHSGAGAAHEAVPGEHGMPGEAARVGGLGASGCPGAMEQQPAGQRGVQPDARGAGRRRRWDVGPAAGAEAWVSGEAAERQASGEDGSVGGTASGHHVGSGDGVGANGSMQVGREWRRRDRAECHVGGQHGGAVDSGWERRRRRRSRSRSRSRSGSRERVDRKEVDSSCGRGLGSRDRGGQERLRESRGRSGHQGRGRSRSGSRDRSRSRSADGRRYAAERSARGGRSCGRAQVRQRAGSYGGGTGGSRGGDGGGGSVRRGAVHGDCEAAGVDDRWQLELPEELLSGYV